MHYDYGMRAVKSVLKAAGNLRLAHSHESEDSIVLRSINNVNLPKFLPDDIPLFNGIISDLFPGVVLPPGDYYGSFMHTLRKHMHALKLEDNAWFVQRVVQIYEMIRVRHGMMIIGNSLSGKTNAYKVLALTLSEMANDKAQNQLKVNNSRLSILHNQFF